VKISNSNCALGENKIKKIVFIFLILVADRFREKKYQIIISRSQENLMHGKEGFHRIFNEINSHKNIITKNSESTKIVQSQKHHGFQRSNWD